MKKSEFRVLNAEVNAERIQHSAFSIELATIRLWCRPSSCSFLRRPARGTACGRPSRCHRLPSWPPALPGIDLVAVEHFSNASSLAIDSLFILTASSFLLRTQKPCVSTSAVLIAASSFFDVCSRAGRHGLAHIPHRGACWLHRLVEFFRRCHFVLSRHESAGQCNQHRSGIHANTHKGPPPGEFHWQKPRHYATAGAAHVRRIGSSSTSRPSRLPCRLAAAGF